MIHKLISEKRFAFIAEFRPPVIMKMRQRLLPPLRALNVGNVVVNEICSSMLYKDATRIECS